MTDEQLTQKLQQHRDWVMNRGQGKPADLRAADLRFLTLDGSDLRFADLRAADLSCASIVGCDFRNADLRGANLRGANCQRASFVNASLQGVNLEGADLRGANLQYADITGARLTKALEPRGEATSPGPRESTERPARPGSRSPARNKQADIDI